MKMCSHRAGRAEVVLQIDIILHSLVSEAEHGELAEQTCHGFARALEKIVQDVRTKRTFDFCSNVEVEDIDEMVGEAEDVVKADWRRFGCDALESARIEIVVVSARGSRRGDERVDGNDSLVKCDARVVEEALQHRGLVDGLVR